ncbi:MAG: hypothetical protein ACK415_01535 [Thermodesulfovibrionales bacterium]
MNLFLVFLFFLILFLIPFIPAIIELLRPKDASPLFIPMDYSKDPRYFGRSFRNILGNAITADTGAGIREVTLSRNEKVEIVNSKRIGKGENVNHILYIIGDLVSENEARFNKEVYVKGNALIGSKNVLRAIACEGGLSLSREVNIVRWADAEGRIEVYDGCDLGINTSSGDELRIGRGCKFKRLYGLPVITYGMSNNNQGLCTDKGDISCDTRIVTKDHMIVPPFSRVEKDLIVKKDLRVKKGCVLIGSIKTYGNLIIEGNVNIFGNIFSEGDIEIWEGSAVLGDVFSQRIITIKKGVRIGSAGMIKSVIGKKGIVIGQDIMIYGYLMTEGLGVVI